LDGLSLRLPTYICIVSVIDTSRGGGRGRGGGGVHSSSKYHMKILLSEIINIPLSFTFFVVTDIAAL
jgi:hypothetical protein